MSTNTPSIESQLRDVLTRALTPWWRYTGAYKTCNHCGADVGPGVEADDIDHGDRCPVPDARRLLTTEDHSGHGRGSTESGPDDGDCVCRTTPKAAECARAGCGFCGATQSDNVKHLAEQLAQVMVERESASVRAGLMESERDAEKIRADAAERMVRERDHYRAKAAVDSTGEMGSQLVETAAWGRAEKARADAAERARDEVGIQLAAAQERIKLLEEGAELLRHIDEFKGEPKWGPNGVNTYRVSCDVIDIGVGSFLARLDTVPGDALASRGVPRFVAGCDTFADDAHKARAVATWASKHAGPFWFVEDTAGDGEKAMCLVGGESIARRIAALLNGDAAASSVTSSSSEGEGSHCGQSGIPCDALTPKVAKDDEHHVVARVDLNTGRWHKLRVFHVIDEARAYFDELMAELEAAPTPGVFIKINSQLATDTKGVE